VTSESRLGRCPRFAKGLKLSAEVAQRSSGATTPHFSGHRPDQGFFGLDHDDAGVRVDDEAALAR
jgi:hypothetical protein